MPARLADTRVGRDRRGAVRRPDRAGRAAAARGRDRARVRRLEADRPRGAAPAHRRRPHPHPAGQGRPRQGAERRVARADLRLRRAVEPGAAARGERDAPGDRDRHRPPRRAAPRDGRDGRDGAGARRRCRRGSGDPAAFTEADILFHLGLATGDRQLDDPGADGGDALGAARGVRAVLAPREPQRRRLAGDRSSATARSSRRSRRATTTWPRQRIADHYAAADIASLEVAGASEEGRSA